MGSNIDDPGEREFDMNDFEELNHSPAIPRIRRQLTMGRCCMLASAVMDKNWRVPSVEACEVLVQSLHWNFNGQTIHDTVRQFKARRKLIEAYQADGDVAAALRNLMEATEIAWNLKPSAYVNELHANSASGEDLQHREPSCVRASRAKNADRFVELLSNLGGSGWSRPGKLMCGELLAALVGDNRRPEFTATTMVMFAVDHPTHPQGVLARLVIDRIPGGCGLLVPDAFHCGYLWMPGGTFAKGLHNAWQAARGTGAPISIRQTSLLVRCVGALGAATLSAVVPRAVSTAILTSVTTSSVVVYVGSSLRQSSSGFSDALRVCNLLLWSLFRVNSVFFRGCQLGE